MLRSLLNRLRRRRVVSHHVEIRQRADVLISTDPTSVDLSLALALLWRDLGKSFFNVVDRETLMSHNIATRGLTLSKIHSVFDNALNTIAIDDYETLRKYLAKNNPTSTEISLLDFLSDESGYLLNVEEEYIRIGTILFTVAATLEGFDTYEYHRLINNIQRELLRIIIQISMIKIK